MKYPLQQTKKFIQLAFVHQAVLQTLLYQLVKLEALAVRECKAATAQVEFPPCPGDSGAKLEFTPAEGHVEAGAEGQYQ